MFTCIVRSRFRKKKAEHARITKQTLYKNVIQFANLMHNLLPLNVKIVV